MRKGFRLYVSSSHLLNVVIADCRGRAQCGLHIARIDQAALLRGVCPHPSQAIGLQFQFDRKRVRQAGVLFLKAMNLALNTTQLLHVMPDFVCQHVCLREFTRSAEAAF